MKRSVLFTIISISLLSIIALIGLTQFADMPNSKKNGFIRHWKTDPIALLRTTPITGKFNKIYIDQYSNLFFWGPDPRTILKTNILLDKIDTLIYSGRLVQGMLANDILIDYPKLFFYPGKFGSILSCSFLDTNLRVTKITQGIYTRSLPLSTDRVIIRAFDDSTESQIFKKVNSQNGRLLSQASIIKNQNDAGFSSDGILSYDYTTSIIVYLQRYQNRFFCLDTNLNLLFIGKTIDTVNSNNVNAEHILTKGTNEGIITFTAPRLSVNKDCFFDNSFLYVLSELQADNEKNQSFANNTVIDIYKITQNSSAYFGSIDIPNLHRKKANCIRIYRKNIIAVYDNFIAIYDLKI